MNRKLLFVFLIIALLVSACGGDDKEADPTSPPAKEATKAPTDAPSPDPTEEPQARTPEDLGKEIGAVYVEALVKVIDLVKDLPAADEIKPDVAALKEEYIQKLFALGQERETFSKEDKTAMNMYLYQALDELYADEAQWQVYNDATAYYMQEDIEFNELLVSFNIIGQYAQFELLIDQEPEEAVRLGILDPSDVETGGGDTTTPAETDVELAEEMRSDEGGFALRPIAGYDAFEEGGSIFMSAPDITSDAGPIILVIGGIAEEKASPKELIQMFAEDAGDLELSNQKEITIKGAAGAVADVNGSANDGQEMSGRIVVLFVTPEQPFMMTGGAPPAVWQSEFEAQFEAVLASVSFFEPVASESGPAIEPMPVEELGWEPGWYAYTNGNDVKGMALHDGMLYAAGAGGMVVWDTATGEYVKHTTLDGLLHISAWDVTYCEIPEPRVIVATEVGLSVFDPASGEWDNTPITPEDSNVAGSNIDLVHCDAENGRLLIDHYGLGVLDINSGEFTRYTDKEGLTWNGVRDVAVSGSDIWIASGYNGVSHISGDQIATYNEDGGMPEETIFAIEVAADGSVWMGSSKGLIKFSGGVWTLYDRETVEDMPGDLYQIELGADGTVWVGSSYGFVCQFDPTSETCLTTFQDADSRYVTDMLMDDAGKLVFSNYGGVFTYDGSAISEMIIAEDVLVSNFVDSLAIDAAGMLWVGTYSGMQVFDPADPSTPLQLFRYEYGEQGPGGNWSPKLLPQPDGSMWALITNGEASYYDGQTWTVYEDYYSYDAIAVDAGGRVWLGDGGEGIAILDGDSASTLTSADGLPDDEVNALLADGDVMWIGVDSGLVRYQDGEMELIFDEEQASEQLGLRSATIRDIQQDANGDLLLGMYGSILRYDGIEVTMLLKFGDLGSDMVYAAFKEMDLGPDGQMWVGTTEGLLYSKDGQNWDWFDTSSGLQSNSVEAVLVDQFGTVWVGGGYGSGGGGLSRYVP